jgi:hypothetical protein
MIKLASAAAGATAAITKANIKFRRLSTINPFDVSTLESRRWRPNQNNPSANNSSEPIYVIPTSKLQQPSGEKSQLSSLLAQTTKIRPGNGPGESA